jgi:hypothetical protein
MKCINCGTDNRLKDRTDNLGRCKNCGHDFVFEPTIMLAKSKVTDPFFEKLISDLSANNTLFFTSSQLYYLLNKRLRSREQKNDLVVGFFVGLLILIILTASLQEGSIAGTIGSVFIGLCAVGIYFGLQRQQARGYDRLLIDRSQFDRWLTRWNSINNPPEKILPPPQTTSLPAAPNPEVTAYSFDRLVVCDTPEIAQLLISNNFHFENNCAILSIDGYPQNIFDMTMEMLRRNTDLKVYALHNCTPAGIQLTHRLRQDNNWFPDSAIPIIDVGILPRQIIDTPELLTLQSPESARLAQQLSPEFRANLNPKELAWLDDGCYLELESFSPQKLIRIIQLAISENRELATIESDRSIGIDNPNFYIVDSFG